MSMDSAAKVVVAMDSINDLSHSDNDNTKKLSLSNDKDVAITTDNNHDKDYVTKEELRDIIEGLTKTIQQQNEYLNKRLEERDRVLMTTLREIQDTKKQIAVSSEQKIRLGNGFVECLVGSDRKSSIGTDRGMATILYFLEPFKKNVIYTLSFIVFCIR
ncbi:DUF3967 domain-containing protein [Bacillus cereus]